MSNTSNSNFFLGFWLAVAFIVSAFIISGSYKDVHSIDQTITVKGYSEKIIESDLALWRVSFSTFATDRINAYSMLENDRQTVINYLKDNGISDENIRIEPVNTGTEYYFNDQGYRTNQVMGYTIYQTLIVSSNDVYKIDELARKSNDLIKMGINYNPSYPEYTYSKLDDLKIEIIGDATADARNRASEIAQKSGSKIGKLISARQGVFQITPPNSTEVSDYGMYDLSTIQKAVKSVVTIEFTID